MIATRAEDNAIVVAYCNLVGGQDELVFDGQSLIVDEDGQLLARAAAFEEELLVIDLPLQRVFEERLHDPRRRKADIGSDDAPPVERVDLGQRRSGERPPLPQRAAIDAPPVSRTAEILAALTLGLGDYFRKNGFREACLGVSGGIDSAVTAAIAVRALGPDRVHGFYLPSRYSSETSRRGARELCANLGIAYREIPIDSILASFLGALEPQFGNLPADTTEENLQARIRGNLLMAFSNKFGWLVLAPGNKSEMSVGYSTLYGDMVGGFAILKDLLKTGVYEVAEEINRQSGRELIPRETIERAPTAELKPGQKDTDTLPPYDALDPILEAYVERDLARGGDRHARLRRRSRAVGRGRRGQERVQAPPGAAGSQDHDPRLRQGSPDADHQPLPRLAAASCGRPRAPGRTPPAGPAGQERQHVVAVVNPPHQ